MDFFALLCLCFQLMGLWTVPLLPNNYISFLAGKFQVYKQVSCTLYLLSRNPGIFNFFLFAFCSSMHSLEHETNYFWQHVLANQTINEVNGCSYRNAALLSECTELNENYIKENAGKNITFYCRRPVLLSFF